MRRSLMVLVAALSSLIFAFIPPLAMAEVDKAVIAILGGMT